MKVHLINPKVSLIALCQLSPNGLAAQAAGRPCYRAINWSGRHYGALPRYAKRSGKVGEEVKMAYASYVVNEPCVRPTLRHSVVWRPREQRLRGRLVGWDRTHVGV